MTKRKLSKIESNINKLFPSRIESPNEKNELPQKDYMVYILTFNDSPIVVGHGKKNRAQIIFDSKEKITGSHIKSLLVRLYVLYGEGIFERFIIRCENKKEAEKIETSLHKFIGGNTKNIPPNIWESFLLKVKKDSATELAIKIALLSSFDGFSDLKKFKRNELLSEDVWYEIIDLFELRELRNSKSQKAFLIE